MKIKKKTKQKTTELSTSNILTIFQLKIEEQIFRFLMKFS